MGIKSEKKKLNGLRRESSGASEFIENLFDQLGFYKLPEVSKKAIKGVLAKKYREFEIIGSSEHDRRMRSCLAQFQSNITYSDHYKKCVQEVSNNNSNLKMINLFAEMRNSPLNIINKKKRKK